MIPSIGIRATSLSLSLGLSLLVLAPSMDARGARLHENADPAGVRTQPARHAAVHQDARARVEVARRTLQQLQRAAQAAGTAEFADVADLMSDAQAQAQAAQTAFRGGDFSAALSGFEAAVQTIRRAVAATAAAATAARQQADAASRGALEAIDGASAQIERGRNLERRGRFNDARLAYLEAISVYEGSTGTGPENALLAVLDAYEKAMEAEDIAAYRALFVNIDPNLETGMSAAFEQFDSWQIELSGTEVVAHDEETATVRTIQNLRFVDVANGGRVADVIRLTFTLRKSGDTWLIEARTQESIQ